MPAGIVRSKCSRTGGAAADSANVTSRKRISGAGSRLRGCDRLAAARRPARIAGSRRSTAATGAAAPSSAQLKPAEGDHRHADRGLRVDDDLAERRAGRR